MIQNSKLRIQKWLQRSYSHFLIITSSFLLLAAPNQAQTTSFYSARGYRILIVLDGSGSMADAWNGTTKWKIATDLLQQVIDSVELKNPKVQFALRVFGHQSPREIHDCKDTKLEVGFATKNSPNIKSKLAAIKAQGWSPIAYAMFNACADFPVDSNSTNAIILITDGIENCDGDVCAVIPLLEKKRIALKPFIVGLGLDSSSQKILKCMGSVYNADNEITFRNVMNVVISQALNNTSAQINLLDAYGNPTETATEVTLLDHFTGRVKYQFVHQINAAGNPDTIMLDPIGKYDLLVHSNPAVRVNNIELNPGKHNMIAADVPQGWLDLEVEGDKSKTSALQCIIRKAGTNEFLEVQDFNRKEKYIVGTYDLEILSTPRVLKYNIDIDPGKTKLVTVGMPGTLQLSPTQPGVATLFYYFGDELTKVFDFGGIKTPQSLELLPGDYVLIWRPDKGKRAVLTQNVKVNIKPLLPTKISLN